MSGTATKSATAGVATFNDLSIDKVGSGYTLTVSSAGLTGANSNAFNIAVGAAAKVAFSTQPANAAAGTAIPGPATVTVQDSFGNTVTSSSASITVAIGTNPSGGVLSGTIPKNATSGVASFSDLSINQAGTGYTLTASSAGLTGASSSAFNISAPVTGGTIAGVITRVSNATAISGALVEAIQGTTIVASAATNASGNYSIVGLSSGSYTVRASSTGLVPQMIKNVAVTFGNTTTVDLSLNFGIAVHSPIAGATINDFSVLVTGLFDTTLTFEAGIKVNGFVALQDGDEFAVLIPINSQTTTLTVTLTDATGNLLAGEVVPITPQLASGTLPLTFKPSPVIALVAEPVGFSLSSRNPIVQLELDGNGDGTIDFTGTTLDAVTVTFAQSGLYFPTVRVTESGGAVRTLTAMVQIFDQTQFDTILQAKWSAMKNALRQGDINATLPYIISRRRTTYQNMFSALTVPFANIDQILTNINFVRIRGVDAEYQMSVIEGGIEHSYLVLFSIDEDGMWRLRFF